MDPETNIETRTYSDHPRRASRAPWDPPPRPSKPGSPRRRATLAERRLDEPAVLGGYYADLGRGVD
jgi:hypothetical protein